MGEKAGKEKGSGKGVEITWRWTLPRQLRYRLPSVPQHVVQRGNNKQVTFYDEYDYRRYLEDLQEAC